ncbi:MAG TPA: amino acid ABC transporter substrate-binding protein [Thermoflexia bacterium]|jgi:polar amino acid transport system substrate-binding protein|nr:amino acid ABC transporter substrate-binding protein [Thermoflexia bacterium]
MRNLSFISRRSLIAVLVLLLATCRPSPDALDRVLETGVLRVGMDASYPPFEYIDGEGNLVGFDVDLAREIATRLGVEPRFVANLPYDGLYDSLTAEQVDVVISALYVDPTRTADFTYSTPYFDAGQVLVMAEGTEGIDGMADLDGRTVAVEFGSAGDVEARAWARRLASLTILPCQTADEALAKVAAGEADAALVDHLSALMTSMEGLRIVEPMVTSEPYAIAVRREDRRLLEAIDEILAAMRDDGTLDRLQARWFTAAP